MLVVGFAGKDAKFPTFCENIPKNFDLINIREWIYCFRRLSFDEPSVGITKLRANLENRLFFANAYICLEFQGMDYKETQNQELEALEMIYSDELEIVSSEYRNISMRISLHSHQVCSLTNVNLLLFALFLVLFHCACLYDIISTDSIHHSCDEINYSIWSND